jgi:hypothetical protein
MKFQVTMKDPDTLIDAIDNAHSSIDIANIDLDEKDMIIKKRKDEILSLCHKWFEYGEYLVVEIDTEAETCTVVPVD